MKWRNWSGYVSCEPGEIARPQSEAGVAQVIRQSRERGATGIRAVGAGHSFTPLVPTDRTLVSLEHLRGLVDADETGGTVTVRSGTTIRELGQLLAARGLAQENLGDIDTQSLAGAISTGTHGTGARLGSISTQVEALRIVTADGEVRECSRETAPELFDAARVSLGALGIISAVQLRVVPAFRLAYRFERTRIDDCLARLDDLAGENRNFELYWFPHSDWVQLKILNETERPVTRGHRLGDLVLENGLFWCFSELCRRFPSRCESISRLCGRLVSSREGVGPSHRVFVAPRLVRFQEMEYSVPRERFTAVFEQIRETIARDRCRVHFPIECRFVAGDDIWLSPAHERDSVYLAIHMYRGMPWREYFDAVEPIFLANEGRPHWGKWHGLGAEQLAGRYPRWSDFLAVRRRVDPDGIFLNDHLRRLFGSSTAGPT